MAYLSPDRPSALPKAVPPLDGDQGEVTGAGSGSAAKRQNLLTLLARKRRLKDEVLSPSDQNFLKTFSCIEAPKGELAIYDGGRKIGAIDDHGVSIAHTEPPDGRENIEAVIKSGLAYKASFGSNVSIVNHSEIEGLIQAKAATFIGLKVENPPFKTTQELDAALEKASPGLVRKMEAEWAREQAASKLGATDQYSSNQRTPPTAAPELITKPIAIDKILPGTLTQNFAQSVQGLPAERPAPPSPAPASPSKPVFS